MAKKETIYKRFIGEIIMKITKSKLKQMIQEELSALQGAVVPGQPESREHWEGPARKAVEKVQHQILLLQHLISSGEVDSLDEAAFEVQKRLSAVQRELSGILEYIGAD